MDLAGLSDVAAEVGLMYMHHSHECHIWLLDWLFMDPAERHPQYGGRPAGTRVPVLCAINNHEQR